MTENAFWTITKDQFNLENDLNVFKTWNTVLSVPIYYPYQFQESYGPDLLEMWKSLPADQQSDWIKALKEPFLGHTQQSYDAVKMNFKMGNTIAEVTPWTLKCGHHVMKYLTETDRNLNDYDQIVEFGAGIGETCRIINDLGYKKTYYLYDLPQVLRISSFYNAHNTNVIGVRHYSQVPQNKKTLFIATWSLSEVPFDYRDEVVTHFKDADFLIIYQKHIFEYDNTKYFGDRFTNIIGKGIQLHNIDWLDGISGGNKYLFNL